MPDENRVFDISRPGRGQPQATSKPVIVGHHPVINDPMVRGGEESQPTKIQVDDSPHGFMTSEPSAASDSGLTPMAHHDLPVYDPPKSTGQGHATSAPALYDKEPMSTGVDPLNNPLAAAPAPKQTAPAPEPFQPEPLNHPAGHVEALRPSPNAKRRSPLKWLLIVLLLAAIAAYVLLGTGVIKSSLSLPPFKKKTETPAAATTPPASQAQNQTATSLPAGFSQYQLTGTDITFAAPTAWGKPNSSSDPGFSKRGTNIQSDGTHAYIIDFPNNKDVQMAVTSNKFLPATRASQYYDYLQWCTGTADKKVYFATLEFTTAADKTDTPSTVVCNQGPLADAQKLDSATIFEPAVKNTANQVIGDLYTKNLTDSNLPVLRVKDAKSANSAQIKQLLTTIKAPVQ